MARLLIVFALLAFIVLVARRGRALRAPHHAARPSAPGMLQRLVCGACGAEFEPEKSGWICPKCGK